MDSLLDNLLTFSLPWTMALQVKNQSAQTNTILDAIPYIKGTKYNSVQCYLLKRCHCVPLQKYLKIQLYNNHFFKPHSSSIFHPSIDRLSKHIDNKAFQSHTHLVNSFPPDGLHSGYGSPSHWKCLRPGSQT